MSALCTQPWPRLLRPPKTASSPPPASHYKRLLCGLNHQDPAGFWAKEAEEYAWKKKWEPGHMEYNLDTSKGPVSITWFKGAKTNITYNALDRYVCVWCVS